MNKLPIFKNSRGPHKAHRWQPVGSTGRRPSALWTLFGAALLGVTMVVGPLTVLRVPQAAGQAANERDQTADDREPSTQDGGEAPKRPAPADLLQRARDRLQGYRPIKAKLVERVRIGDRRFKAEGNYLHGTNLKLRLDIRIRLGTSDGGLEGSLLQICDGDILWTRHKIGDDVQITRRDVREILRAAQSHGDIPQNVLVADLGLGGLPAILASLEDTMSFERVRDERLGDDQFLMVEGTWNQEYLDRLVNLGQTGDGSATERLSPPRLAQHLPEKVRVYFDPATLFPRRIQYLKRPPEREFFRPMVTLDFVEIVLNAPVNQEEFLFVAGPDAPQQVDITNRYLQLLEQRGSADEDDVAPSGNLPSPGGLTPPGNLSPAENRPSAGNVNPSPD